MGMRSGEVTPPFLRKVYVPLLGAINPANRRSTEFGSRTF